MKIKNKEVYYCEYCNKLYQSKYHCEKHEKGCKKSPDYDRPCHSCNVLEKVEAMTVTRLWDNYENESERKVNVLFCKERDCFIYPPSVAAKGNAFDMGMKLNIEMPKECVFYK